MEVGLAEAEAEGPLEAGGAAGADSFLDCFLDLTEENWST